MAATARERLPDVYGTTDGEAEDSTSVLLYLAHYEPDGEVRRYAIRALGRSDDSEVLPCMDAWLRSPNYGVRLNAAKGISVFDPTRACPIIVDTWLRGPDPDPYVEDQLAMAVQSCAELLLEYRESHPERVEPVIENLPAYLRTWEE